MTVCRYFLEGRCHYGDKCWYEHPTGGRNQPTYGGGGSVNRKWVNPSQRVGGAAVQPNSFSRGGGDWGRGGDWGKGNSGTGKDEWNSNFSFNTQNRFSTLDNTHSGGGRGGGEEGGEEDTDKQLDMIQKDMEAWQSSGQWLFSCYAVLKSSITGFVELSPEELRMEYYTSRATGDLQSYVNSVQQLVNQWRSRVQELRTMSGHTRTSMIAEMSNPRTQTFSGGGGDFSSASAASAGFGSTPSAGFGSTPSGGFGSTPSAGFGSTPSAGFGSTPSAGFGSTPSGGFGSSPSAGFGSTPSGGFGSTPSAGFSSSSGFQAAGFGSSVPNAADFSFSGSGSGSGFGSFGSQAASCQFGSSAPSASSFSFAPPEGAGPGAAAGRSSTAGFGFSSTSAGGFGGSSAAPSGGAFGGGGGGGVGGVTEDRKSAGELHTPVSDLTPDELREFSAKRFTLGQIPLRAPPTELLHV